MGININDLNNSIQPISASPLSSNENISDNIRELSDKELKISGGTGNSQLFQPVFRPVSQPVFRPVSQPVFQARPFGSNINIDLNSSSSSISSSSSFSESEPVPVIVTEPEPEPERLPTTISY